MWKDEEPKGGQYPAGLMTFWACLVLEAGASLRGVERILLVLNETFGLRLPIPDWTTGRTWIIRLGLWELRRPLPKADAKVRWGWIADHAVQIGNQKVLFVLGVMLQNLPKIGRWEPLQMQDMQLVGLIPMSPSNAETVDKALEMLVARTGLPDVIVNDLGADLHGGVKRFCERHPETLEIYDAAHKGACLLKARLEKDEHWKKFQSLCGQTRVQTVQTELACLMPPRLRMKSRYMNLEPVLSCAVWAWGMLRESRAGQPPLDITAARVEEKLPWLDAFGEKLPEWQEWQEWQEQIEAMLETVRQQGHSRETPALLKSRMPAAVQIADHDPVLMVRADSDFINSNGSRRGTASPTQLFTHVLLVQFFYGMPIQSQLFRQSLDGRLPTSPPHIEGEAFRVQRIVREPVQPFGLHGTTLRALDPTQLKRQIHSLVTTRQVTNLSRTFIIIRSAALATAATACFFRRRRKER